MMPVTWSVSDAPWCTCEPCGMRPQHDPFCLLHVAGSEDCDSVRLEGRGRPADAAAVRPRSQLADERRIEIGLKVGDHEFATTRTCGRRSPFLVRPRE